MEEEKTYFYKLNVPYNVNVRRFRGDFDAVLLDNSRPFIEIKAKDNKVFRDVNKYQINQGLILEVAEPQEDFQTSNALNDEEIGALLSNYLKLKNAVNNIDSLPILYKIREAAKEKDVSKRTVSLITARITELEPEDDEGLNEAINARKEVRG